MFTSWHKSLGGKSRQHSRSVRKLRRSNLQMEPLEDRQLMAGDTPEAFVQQGTLYIYGTQNDDHIEIRLSADKIEIPGVAIKNANGQQVTSLSRAEVPYQVIATGQAGNDYIAMVEIGGAPLPAVIYGNQGDDVLIGGSSDDALIGQDGIDTLYGNGGHDKLIAALYANAQDPAQEGMPAENLLGGAGNDVIYGSGGRDQISGGDGDDQLFGLGGNDSLYGDGGSDTYDGGNGFDEIEESDLFAATATNDRLDVTTRLSSGEFSRSSTPMSGVEKVTLMASRESNGVTLDATAFSGQANLYGSEGNDVLKSGSGNDFLWGVGGADQLSAGKGQNFVDGGAGIDTVFEELGREPVALTDSSYRGAGVTNDLRLIENATFNYPFPLPTTLIGGRIDAVQFSGDVKVQNFSRVEITGNFYATGRLQSPYGNALSNRLDTDPAIVALYKSLKGANGILGPATGAPVNVPGGQYVNYKNGMIYKTSTGAFAPTGWIWIKYILLGGHNSSLGLPTSSVQQIGSATSQATFQNGVIVDHSVLTRHYVYEVHGEIYKKWKSLGGAQVLGYPRSDEISLQVRGVNGAMSKFAGGDIYWSPGTGAHAITGPYRDRYATDADHSTLGYPTSDVFKLDNRGGAVTFQYGAILSSSPAKAYQISGWFYGNFVKYGGITTFGYPVNDVHYIPYNTDGISSFGHEQNFENGRIAKIADPDGWWVLSRGGEWQNAGSLGIRQRGLVVVTAEGLNSRHLI